MDNDTIIKVEHLNKNFKLPHQKLGSVKNFFTNIFSLGNRSFEIQHALKDVSFEVKRGEFFGIVGRNGSGKSTMLKILAGIYQPTDGNVFVDGRVVPFIELGVGFNGELSGRENVFLNGALLGFSEKEIAAKYDDIVDFAELERFMDQKLKNYSSGMQVRLAFSVATRLAESDILLIDEVLAVGDSDFQRKCFNYFRDLKRQNKTVVFVSHDMNAIREYCDRAVLIEKNEVVLAGPAYEVSNAYIRMFAEEGAHSAEDLATGKERWGNKDITYTSVKVEPKVAREDQPFKLITEAVVNKPVTEAILGFKVKSHEGVPVYGSNTKIKRAKDLQDLQKGDKISVEWELPNILNDGSHSLDVAIEGQDYSEVYDWWQDAARFQVEKVEANSYSIHPIVAAKVKVTRAK